MSNFSKDLTMPGTRLLLRISVLLPIASVFVLGLTAAWQQARIPDTQIIVLTIVALLPALIVYLPLFERWLGTVFLIVALSVYLGLPDSAEQPVAQLWPGAL